MELTIEQALFLAGYGHRKGRNHNTDRRDTGETREGSFWFFHHGHSGAGRGRFTSWPCRVYEVAQ